MSSAMITKIYNEGTTLSILRTNFLKYEYVVGPVQINNSHWALFVASIKTQQISYIDPLGASETDKNLVYNNWRIFCNQRSMKNLTWTAYNPNHILQTDDCNCGVYVCYFYKKYTEQNLNSLQMQFNKEAFRLEINQTIMSQIIKKKIKFYLNIVPINKTIILL